MGTIDEEAASKFINALVKSVQTLCHGYLDFDSGIEIIGHINLSVDKVGSLDYILKEKVCKNNENSTLFISNSFHAQPKSEQTAKAKNSQSETVLQRRQSSDNESGRVSSAISSISSALSSAKESSANSTGSRPQQSTAKRKAHDDLNNDHRPAKSVSRDAHHFLSSHSQPSPHDTRSSSPIDSKPAIGGVSAGFDSSPRTSSADGSATMLPQTANVTSDNQSELDVNLEGSVLEPVDDQSNSEMPERDDSDLDLEVTFIKEEFVEGERSACEFQGSGGGQQYGRTHQRASTSSDGMGEQPLFPVALHSSASATYVPGSQDMVGLAQHYAGSHGSSTSQPHPGPSGMRDAGWLGGAGKGLSHHIKKGWLAVSSASVGSVKQEILKSPASAFPDQTSVAVLRQAVVLGGASDLSTGLTLPATYICTFCNARFQTQNGLTLHTKMHPQSASLCATRVDIQTAAVHLECDKCGKRFRKREVFVQHMNMHNKIKTFSCPNCPKKFVYKSSLKFHMKECSENLNIPLYKCDKCERGFIRREHYIGHMNVHNNVKTYTCPYCPKKFAHKSSLRFHLKSCY